MCSVLNAEGIAELYDATVGSDADDATNATFIKLLITVRANGAITLDHPEAYVRRAIRNHVVSAARKQQRERALVKRVEELALSKQRRRNTLEWGPWEPVR